MDLIFPLIAHESSRRHHNKKIEMSASKWKKAEISESNLFICWTWTVHTAIASTDLPNFFYNSIISWSRVWSCLWIESWTWHVSCQVWTCLNPWWLYAQTRFGYLKLFKIWRHDLFKNDLFHTLPFLQTRTNCFSALMAWHISLRSTILILKHDAHTELRNSGQLLPTMEHTFLAHLN